MRLTPETEERLRHVAAGRGLAPEAALEALLDEAEAALQETLAGLRVSAEDFAAGRWSTPDDLDAALRTRAAAIRTDSRRPTNPHA